jgi:hypothetical protein
MSFAMIFVSEDGVIGRIEPLPRNNLAKASQSDALAA